MGSILAFYYCCVVRVISITHIAIIILNLASVPFLIWKQPFYIWMPLITLLVSPLIGGQYCMFNKLENYYREKANMPLINDRSEAFVEEIKSIYKGVKKWVQR